MKNVIADRTLTGVDNLGREFKIHIRVGRPVKTNEGAWACSVEAAGLRKNLADQHGPDPFQVTLLAFGLLQGILKEFIADGGKVLGVGDRAEVNVLELFKPVR
jgi:hypothetical protein